MNPLLLRVNTEELRQLDEASKRAEVDIDEMVNLLDTNAKSHKAFMLEIGKLREEASR